MTGIAFERRVLLQLRQHRHAVHHRHGDVEQDEVWFFAGRRGETFLAVRRLAQDTIVGPERPAHDEPDGAAIVNA